MCWMVTIHVVLQKDTPANRSLIVPPPEDTCFLCEGGFPDYLVTGGGCGCGTVVEPDGAALVAETLACARHFLAIDPVKRVEMRWWFGDLANPPELRETRPISLKDFEELNARGDLRAEAKYRITDHARFRYA